MYDHTFGKVKVDEQLSTQRKEFIRVTSYHPFFSISPFMNQPQSGIDVLVTGSYFDLDDIDNIACSLISFGKAQASSERCGSNFALSKCKVMLTALLVSDLD